MKIVYIGNFPLYVQSGRGGLISDLAQAGHEIFQIAPIRLSKYFSHLISRMIYRKESNGIKFIPFLRMTRKMKKYENQRILDILQQNGLTDNRSVIMSANKEICSHLKDTLSSSVTVFYYILDRYSEYDNLTEQEKRDFDQREAEIIKKVDGTLCVSQKLLSEAKVLNNKSFWFPNAVKYDQIVTHRDMQDSSKTIGMISKNLSRIDWSLMCRIAASLNDYNIELIGINDLGKVEGCPSNIKFLGKVPFEELPKYVSRWKAGLALYERSRFNEYCCPLKFFEYSSLNIPTVTTTIPEARVFAQLYPGIIYLADDVNDIVARVREIAEKAGRIDYTKLARENKWSVRANQLISIIKEVKTK